MQTIRSLLITATLALASLSLAAQITETHTFTTNRVVPDGHAAGLSDVRTISSSIANIGSVAVRLKVAGEFNGDLYAYVRHASGFAVLVNRAGKTAAHPAGYDDSGFNVTFRAGAANGDVHLYRSVNTPALNAALTGDWQIDGRTNDPSSVTETSLRTALLTSFNGLNAAGEWTLYIADVESGGTNMLEEWSLEITGPAPPALAWSNPADITYGAPLGSSQLNAAVTYDSTNVNGTFAYTPSLGSILNAGAAQTLAVTFTPADSSSFLPVSTNVSINVLRAPLTIAVADKTKVYGAPLPELTATYSGFVPGEGTNNLTALAALGTTATANSGVGVYEITASGASSPNYTFNYVNGTLTVTQSLTAVAISSLANPALPGANVTFTATVTPLAPGAGTPTGTVHFRIDGNVAGSGTLSGGATVFMIHTLGLGSHTVLAEYAGDLNFAGATNQLAPVQVINTPPVAGHDTIERYPTQGTKVRLSTLLTNDSDADADALSVTVSPASTHSASITVSNDWVFYMPSVGFMAEDSFTYTIADSRGGNAMATVSVMIKTDNDPGQNLTITALGGGSFRIRGSGIPHRTYRLQYSDTINPGNWQDLTGAGVTADATGVFEYVDTFGSAARYYRSVFP